MSPARTRLRLVHWKPEEAAAQVARLEAAGYAVDAAAFEPATLRALKKDPPAAVLIDLSRLPSHGRDVGLALRESKATRHVPLVFLGGAEDKVERARRSLPDAVYASWRGVRGAVKRALASPPAAPVVPSHRLAGYSGTPLAKKLGVREGARVALLNAPQDFEATLGELPAGATVTRRPGKSADVALLFVKSQKELATRFPRAAALAGDTKLWICWPKQASGLANDLTQDRVRRTGLDAGLVDFKICAVDATWSGLCFTRRKR